MPVKRYGQMSIAELEADLADGNTSMALLKALERKRLEYAASLERTAAASPEAAPEQPPTLESTVTSVLEALGVTPEPAGTPYEEAVRAGASEREADDAAAEAAKVEEADKLGPNETPVTNRYPAGTPVHLGKVRGTGRLYLVKAKTSTRIGTDFADEAQARAFAEARGWVPVSGFTTEPSPVEADSDTPEERAALAAASSAAELRAGTQ